MNQKAIALYSLVLGIAILGVWSVILIHGEIPEGRTAFSFHLFSEILMALACMTAGILILKRHRFGRGVAIAAHAMVLYSVLNASGYYAQRGERMLPVIFVILFLISTISIIILIKRKRLL
jgi:hypothetical protein